MVTLQQGLAGYAGGRDTYLSATAAEANFANAPILPLTAGGSTSLLFRFDLDSIPANAQLVRATISLRAQERSAPVRLFAELYEVTQPWDADSATWNEAQTGVAWQTPGGQIDEAPLGRKVLLAERLWYTLDVTSLVQRWLTGGAPNHGVLLRATSDAPVTFGLASSDYTISTLRPRLNITYRLLPVTPTPTPTATPLPTPTPSVTPTATASPTPTATPLPAEILAKIEILWPHGGLPASQADLANLTAYLFSDDALDPVACDWEPVVRLWRARNEEPARSVGIGTRRLVTQQGRTFPVWDFNDVDVSAARSPGNTLYFFVTVDDTPTRHNVWSHGIDATVTPPTPPVPTAVVTSLPARVDAAIVTLQPNAGLPQATTADLTGYLFVHETERAVFAGSGDPPTVRLRWSLDNDVAQAGLGLTGAARTTSAGDVSWTAWDFAGVDVSAARNAQNRLYFWLDVPGSETYPTIWAYGADIRTSFPVTDLPARSCVE